MSALARYGLCNTTRVKLCRNSKLKDQGCRCNAAQVSETACIAEPAQINSLVALLVLSFPLKQTSSLQANRGNIMLSERRGLVGRVGGEGVS